jgi:release factor glutamine methyltransferase
LLGEAWFSGLRLAVDDSVLIPRPETDELVDWIGKDLANIIYDYPSFKILDIGTGSGCISLGLKKKLFKVELTGIDISEKALGVAKTNSDTYLANINLKKIDFLDEAQWDELDVYNVIVSNPPYIKELERATMHKNVLDYEPAIALFVPDADPLLYYKKIALFAQKHLAENGFIYVEINEALGHETVELFKSNGYLTQLKKDFQGKNRMIKAWHR